MAKAKDTKKDKKVKDVTPEVETPQVETVTAASDNEVDTVTTVHTPEVDAVEVTVEKSVEPCDKKCKAKKITLWIVIALIALFAIIFVLAKLHVNLPFIPQSPAEKFTAAVYKTGFEKDKKVVGQLTTKFNATDLGPFNFLPQPFSKLTNGLKTDFELQTNSDDLYAKVYSNATIQDRQLEILDLQYFQNLKKGLGAVKLFDNDQLVEAFKVDFKEKEAKKESEELRKIWGEFFKKAMKKSKEFKVATDMIVKNSFKSKGNSTVIFSMNVKELVQVNNLYAKALENKEVAEEFSKAVEKTSKLKGFKDQNWLQQLGTITELDPNIPDDQNGSLVITAKISFTGKLESLNAKVLTNTNQELVVLDSVFSYSHSKVPTIEVKEDAKFDSAELNNQLREILKNIVVSEYPFLNSQEQQQ